MRRIAFIVALIALAGGLWAQAGFLSKIGFGIKSSPEENGNITEAELTYRIKPNWTAAIRMKSQTSAETAKIPAADDSLNLIHSTNTEVFVYPFELRILLKEDSPLYLGGGLYVSSQGTREVGFFTLDDLPVPFNSYDNDLKATFYGPVIDAGMTLELPKTSLKLDAIIVPFFLYSTKQEMSIDPLLSTVGKNDASGSGFPYIAIKLKPTFFDILGPDIAYEYQRFAYTSLSESPTDNTLTNWVWTKESSTYDIHTLTLRGELCIPLFNRAQARIGYGRKLTWTVPEGDADAIFDNKGTMTLEFKMNP